VNDLPSWAQPPAAAWRLQVARRRSRLFEVEWVDVPTDQPILTEFDAECWWVSVSIAVGQRKRILRPDGSVWREMYR
jgi:hypothetical protein